jgi:hypothetical protein
MKRRLKYKVLFLLTLISFIACKKVVVEFPKCDATIFDFSTRSYILTNNKLVSKKVISISSDTFVLVLSSKIDRRSWDIPCDYPYVISNYLQDFTIYTVSSSDTILVDTCFMYTSKTVDLHISDFVDEKQIALIKKPKDLVFCLLKNNTYVPNDSYFRFMVVYKLSDGVVGKSLSDTVLFTNETIGL